MSFAAVGVGQVYPWGAIDSAQQQNSRSFSGPPPILPREQPRKATISIHCMEGGYWSSYRGVEGS